MTKNTTLRRAYAEVIPITMQIALDRQHQKGILYFLQREKYDRHELREAFLYAAENGKTKILNEILNIKKEKFTNMDLETGLECAALNNHSRAFVLMLKHYDTSDRAGLIAMYRGFENQPTLVQYLEPLKELLHQSGVNIDLVTTSEETYNPFRL